VSDSEFRVRSNAIFDDLCDLASTYKQGKAVSEGVRTALIGKPNTGKSSLLNLLAGEEKAIVTSVPGTTRDVIEEKVTVGRIVLRLFDTAGIRESADEVERIGIARALKKADEAELVLGLFDPSRALDSEDRAVIEMLNSYAGGGRPVIAVLGKSDLAPSYTYADIRALIAPAVPILTVSAVTGDGVSDLKNAIEGLFVTGHIDYSQTAVLANARQYSAVCEARDAVACAISALDSGMGADVCGLDLEAALAAIGQVDGRSVTDEIVSSIFHNFCVGK
jgi:tRNA modification GTPase